MNDIELIEALGGTAAVAALAGVKPPSVSGWKESGRIPDDKRIRLAPIAEGRGLTTRIQLFPRDWHLIWPELLKVKGAPPIPDSCSGSGPSCAASSPRPHFPGPPQQLPPSGEPCPPDHRTHPG